MSARRTALDALLRLRRRTELRAQVVVADGERRRLALEAEARGAAERIDLARETLRDALEGEVEVAPLRLAAQGAMMHEHRRIRAVAELAAGEPARGAARRALADAGAARKGVELLQARRERESARRIERAEQAALDEIAARHAGGWA